MKAVSPSAQHNLFKVSLKPELEITVRSDFDSGNLGKVEFQSPNTLVMTPANDCAGTTFEGQSKSWFYFKLQDVPSQVMLRFVIKRIHMLASQNKSSDHYRPVFCYKGEPWKRVEYASVSSKDDDTEVQFDHKFEKSVECSFAFTIPLSYEQLQKSIKHLETDNNHRKDIYFHSEVMAKSPQGRNIHLLTVSSYDGRLAERENKLSEHLFNISTRAIKFRSEKKIVLISARVHPGEVPGSHAMNGILEFLLSKDARAMLLRRNLVFMLVPMLNPDGVYHGHYRMDSFNQNLNRFYLTPNPERHPGPFAMRALAEYLEAEKRLCFFLDLHAHAGKCGNFFYGNALETLQQQVESQLYAKVMSLNCANFEYETCNFSKKQMTSKDRNEELTKEGSSRVAMHRISNLVHSYTLECGYHYSLGLNDIKLPSKYHRKLDGHGLLYDQLDNVRSPTYQAGNAYFTVSMYANVGKALLVSILDVFEMNPFSRIPNTQYKDLGGIRKEVEDWITKTVDRFKKPLTFKRNRLTAPEATSENVQQRHHVFHGNRNRIKIAPKSATKIEPKKQSIRVRGLTLPKSIKVKSK